MARRTRVKASGPIFDGRAERAAAQFAADLEDDIAEAGREAVLAETHVFREPTGFYASQIRIEGGRGDKVVTDGGVRYGRWLEFGGRRTFKGYRLWRKAARQLQGSAVVRDADRSISPYLRLMGGR